MNNLIETLSTKYPEQWNEFQEWHDDNCNSDYDKMAEPMRTRYLLADIQAWLDSEGIHCDAYSDINSEYFYGDCAGSLDFKHYKSRPEALTAAVEKGMEIKQQQK